MTGSTVNPAEFTSEQKDYLQSRPASLASNHGSCRSNDWRDRRTRRRDFAESSRSIATAHRIVCLWLPGLLRLCLDRALIRVVSRGWIGSWITAGGRAIFPETLRPLGAEPVRGTTALRANVAYYEAASQD